MSLDSLIVRVREKKKTRYDWTLAKKTIHEELIAVIELANKLADQIEYEQKNATDTIQTYGTFIYWNAFGDPRLSSGESLKAIKNRGAILLKQYAFKYDPKWRNPRDPPGSEYQ